MSVRAIVSIASILLGLVTAAAAQQAETAAAASASSALTNPPVFQGLMVDAKGKTVGRLFPWFTASEGVVSDFVVRQISRVWVMLQVDVLEGLTTSDGFSYFYTSADCVGQAYLAVSSAAINNLAAALPARGYVVTIPPSTQPSIYFAGPPYSNLVINSARDANNGISLGSCYPAVGAPVFVGPAQSGVPVSSLGLTLPFSVE